MLQREKDVFPCWLRRVRWESAIQQVCVTRETTCKLADMPWELYAIFTWTAAHPMTPHQLCEGFFCITPVVSLCWTLSFCQSVHEKLSMKVRENQMTDMFKGSLGVFTWIQYDSNCFTTYFRCCQLVIWMRCQTKIRCVLLRLRPVPSREVQLHHRGWSHNGGNSRPLPRHRLHHCDPDCTESPAPGLHRQSVSC